MRRNVSFFCEPGASYGYFFSGQLAEANRSRPSSASCSPRSTICSTPGTMGSSSTTTPMARTTSRPPRRRARARPQRGRAHHLYGAERTFRVKPEPREEGAVPAKESHWVSVPARSCHALLMAGQDFQGACARRPAAAGRRRAHLVHPSVSRLTRRRSSRRVDAAAGEPVHVDSKRVRDSSPGALE